MQWLFAIVMGIGFVELFLRLPIIATLTDFRELVSRITAVISSKVISDHWKEKVLPRYAFQMFGRTVMIAFYLIVCFVPFLVLLAAAVVLQVPFLEFSMSWTGILFVTVVAVAYVKVRSLYATAKL